MELASIAENNFKEISKLYIQFFLLRNINRARHILSFYAGQ